MIMSQLSIQQQRLPDITAEFEGVLGRVFNVSNGQTAIRSMDAL